MESQVRVVGTIRILSEKHWVVMSLMSHRKIIQPNRYATVTNMDCAIKLQPWIFFYCRILCSSARFLLSIRLGLKGRAYDYNYKWYYKKSFFNELKCQ